MCDLIRYGHRYLIGVLQRVVSRQLSELGVTTVVYTQVQMLVQHPEVFIRPLHQPVSTLRGRTNDKRKWKEIYDIVRSNLVHKSSK